MVEFVDSVSLLDEDDDDEFDRSEKTIDENAGEIYRRKPVKDWPKLTINWNFDTENFKYSFDGFSKAKVREKYPSGFNLVEVNIKVLDNKLYDKPSVEEIWDKDQEKTIRLIGRIILEKKITPPVVECNDGKLILEGGNHRFNILKAIKEEKIWIIVPLSQFQDVLCILNEVEQL